MTEPIASLVVEMRAPRCLHELSPGQRCAAPPKTARYAHGKNDGPWQFFIV
jgi:hypothetical protein